ncbi:MAG: hypothetical protein H7301_13040 [Cryobacterium sp.]|nr:hypothetical protein [Oligoflexia bacterium]
MKMKLGLLLFLISIICSSPASAGGDRTGNGGVGVVCRDSKNEIETVKLFDLYEAETKQHWINSNEKVLNAALKTRESSVTWAAFEVTRVFQTHLSPNHSIIFGGLISDAILPYVDQAIPDALNPERMLTGLDGKSAGITLKKLLSALAIEPDKVSASSRIRFLDQGETLPLSFDFSPVVLPKNCSLEQIGNYTAENILLVSGDLYKRLTPLHQGAFFFHEAVWSIHRRSGITDSDLSRRLVGATYGYIESLSRDAVTVQDQDALRALIALEQITLNLHYNERDQKILHQVKLDPQARGVLYFGFDIRGETTQVNCTVDAPWFNWLTGEEIQAYSLELIDREYEWAKKFELSIGNVGRGQFVPEYQSLRYTSLTPRIYCKLKPGAKSASLEVSFTVDKGNQSLVREKMGTIDLNSKTDSGRLDFKPVLFY